MRNSLIGKPFLVLVIGISAVLAQDVQTARSEFYSHVKKSFELTIASPFRNTTTVETGDELNAQVWKPYSSAITEYILPDRWHFKYTSRGTGEVIQIGRTKYSRNGEGPWTMTQEERGPTGSNPASPMSFGGDIIEFENVSLDVSEKDVTVFRILSKPKPGTEEPDKKTIVWTFWFDRYGILYKHEGVAFNGRNWIRTTQNYEYDPAIKIEAPISN